MGIIVGEKVYTDDGIRRGDEDGIYYVLARNKKDEYKVDLNANTCSCPHWTYRCSFSQKDCKHLDKVKKKVASREFETSEPPEPKTESSQLQECRNFMEEHEEMDCIDLENMFGEDVAQTLIKEGFMYEERGFFKLL